MTASLQAVDTVSSVITSSPTEPQGSQVSADLSGRSVVVLKGERHLQISALARTAICQLFLTAYHAYFWVRSSRLVTYFWPIKNHSEALIREVGKKIDAAAETFPERLPPLANDPFSAVFELQDIEEAWKLEWKEDGLHIAKMSDMLTELCEKIVQEVIEKAYHERKRTRESKDKNADIEKVKILAEERARERLAAYFRKKEQATKEAVIGFVQSQQKRLQAVSEELKKVGNDSCFRMVSGRINECNKLLALLPTVGDSKMIYALIPTLTGMVYSGDLLTEIEEDKSRSIDSYLESEGAKLASFVLGLANWAKVHDSEFAGSAFDETSEIAALFKEKEYALGLTLSQEFIQGFVRRHEAKNENLASLNKLFSEKFEPVRNQIQQLQKESSVNSDPEQKLLAECHDVATQMEALLQPGELKSALNQLINASTGGSLDLRSLKTLCEEVTNCLIDLQLPLMQIQMVAMKAEVRLSLLLQFQAQEINESLRDYVTEVEQIYQTLQAAGNKSLAEVAKAAMIEWSSILLYMQLSPDVTRTFSAKKLMERQRGYLCPMKDDPKKSFSDHVNDQVQGLLKGLDRLVEEIDEGGRAPLVQFMAELKEMAAQGKGYAIPPQVNALLQGISQHYQDCKQPLPESALKVFTGEIQPSMEALSLLLTAHDVVYKDAHKAADTMNGELLQTVEENLSAASAGISPAEHQAVRLNRLHMSRYQDHLKDLGELKNYEAYAKLLISDWEKEVSRLGAAKGSTNADRLWAEHRLSERLNAEIEILKRLREAPELTLYQHAVRVSEELTGEMVGLIHDLQKDQKFLAKEKSTLRFWQSSPLKAIDSVKFVDIASTASTCRKALDFIKGVFSDGMRATWAKRVEECSLEVDILERFELAHPIPESSK